MVLVTVWFWNDPRPSFAEATLPTLRAQWVEGSIWCGPPVARPMQPGMMGGPGGGSGGGEMGELMAMLERLQAASASAGL